MGVRARFLLVFIVGVAALGGGVPRPAEALTNCTVPAADRSVDSVEAQVITLLNNHRASNGRNALRLRADVNRASSWFSRDMATDNYFPNNHNDNSGRSMGTRVTDCDAPWSVVRENIAAGYVTAADVFNAWKNSPGHNTNMLATDITHVGIARAYDAGSTYGWYWTMNFITPLPAPSSVTDTDSDGTVDAGDNCMTVANASQADVDTDIIGDACDDDASSGTGNAQTLGPASATNQIATQVVDAGNGNISIFELEAPGVVRTGWTPLRSVNVTVSGGNGSLKTMTFGVHDSVLTGAEAADTLSMHKDGTRVVACETNGVVGPNPCRSTSGPDQNGITTITVLTISASQWTVAVPAAGSIRAACSPEEIPPAGFNDVQGGSTHAASIDCVKAWDITAGTGPNTYAPAANVRRGQLASFLVRLIEKTGVVLAPGPDAFTDDNGTTHEANINKVAAAGITSGKAPGIFDPDGLVTRAQMASFLVRTYEYVAARTVVVVGSPDSFSDDNGTTHEANINKVAALGIAQGKSPGLYEPGSNVTRDQMASFLSRTLSRFVAEELAPEYADL